MELFIKKYHRNLDKSVNHDRIYSCILEDIEVDYACFLSPQQDVGWTQSQYLSGPSLVGTSNAFDTSASHEVDNASVESEDDDEEDGLQINSITCLMDRDKGTTNILTDVILTMSMSC